MRFLCLLLVASLIACSSAETETRAEPGSFVLSGTVRATGIEVGCWYIETADGTRYEPSGEGLNLILEENLVVEIEVRPMENIASVCQVGTPVSIVRIIRILEKSQ